MSNIKSQSNSLFDEIKIDYHIITDSLIIH